MLSPEATRELLPVRELIPAVGRAFLTPGAAPERVVVPDEGCDWVVMRGLAPGGGLVCKLLRVGDGSNGAAGAPTTAGVVVVLDSDGRVVALLDGGTLTVLRTAAVAAHATSLLASPMASVLALFGPGGLAEAHVEAIDAVRPLAEVRVVGRSENRVAGLCDRLQARGCEASASDPRGALHGADIVATVTSSPEPAFGDPDVAAGVHVNAMGSYRLERVEVPAATVVRARVVVETRESAWAEAGDLIQPLRAGLIDESHVLADLGEPERVAAIRPAEPDAITLFKSVGHVALDLAALDVALGQLAARA